VRAGHPQLVQAAGLPLVPGSCKLRPVREGQGSRWRRGSKGVFHCGGGRSGVGPTAEEVEAAMREVRPPKLLAGTGAGGGSEGSPGVRTLGALGGLRGDARGGHRRLSSSEHDASSTQIIGLARAGL